jgi:hypothetical protein
MENTFILDHKCVTHCSVRVRRPDDIRAFASGVVNSYFPKDLKEDSIVEINLKRKPKGKYKVEKIHYFGNSETQEIESWDGVFKFLSGDFYVDLDIVEATPPSSTKRVKINVPHTSDVPGEITFIPIPSNSIETNVEETYKNKFTSETTYVYNCPVCKERGVTLEKDQSFNCAFCDALLHLEVI